MSNQHIDKEDLITADMTHDVIMGEALERLYDNPDFKTVFLDGYLKEKALASVSLLGVPAMKGDRGGIMEDLVAISNLKFWMLKIEQRLQAARDPILSEEEEAELAKQQEGN